MIDGVQRVEVRETTRLDVAICSFCFVFEELSVVLGCFDISKLPIIQFLFFFIFFLQTLFVPLTGTLEISKSVALLG